MIACKPRSSDTLGVWGKAGCVVLYPVDYPVVVYSVSSLSKFFGGRILSIKVFIVGDILGASITWADGSTDLFAYIGDFAVGFLEEPVKDEASLFDTALNLCRKWEAPMHD